MNKFESSVLKSKNQVTLFVNFGTIVLINFVLLRVCIANRVMVPKCGIFDLKCGVTYGRYPCGWSSYLIL